MLEILSVQPASPAAQLGLLSHDKLISINGNQINDRLDFTYFIQEEVLEFKIWRNNSEISIQSADNTAFSETDWGLELEDYKIKSCGNNCVFCFVHQNPRGLRSTLYVKDEDYRFSFLHGSYFTLTNITKTELERIVTMRLSPLYISVHATRPDIRKSLLGIKKEDNILKKIDYLTAHGIELHTQIVLCPDLNDGEVLKETVLELAARHPGIASVAVVPVGKTSHRNQLPQIRSVTPTDAQQVIMIIDELQTELLPKLETRFVYAADEFYLRAGQPLPEADYYENYDQYENGIGLVRSFLDELAAYRKKLPKALKKPKKVVLVSGKAFSPVLKDSLLPLLQKIRDLDIEVVAAENRLFGPEVTVAGLLSGRDILAAVNSCGYQPDLIVLPPTCLNFDNLFLDDLTLQEFCIQSKSTAVVFTDISRLISRIIE